MQERIKQLEDAFNTNTKVFSDGIQMLEAQNEVLRRVAQHLYNKLHHPDGLSDVTIERGGVIDWNAYLKEYIEELAASEEKKAGPGPVLATPDEDAPIVFGGTGA